MARLGPPKAGGPKTASSCYTKWKQLILQAKQKTYPGASGWTYSDDKGFNVTDDTREAWNNFSKTHPHLDGSLVVDAAQDARHDGAIAFRSVRFRADCVQQVDMRARGAEPPICCIPSSILHDADSEVFYHPLNLVHYVTPNIDGRDPEKFQKNETAKKKKLEEHSNIRVRRVEPTLLTGAVLYAPVVLFIWTWEVRVAET
ncbi:hypothetical protein C8J57DRAFT_1232559 [Mycena rebaudengoi]|nr:hypothetical protein C8J57DRAFT_1232559 [Mycena rebaudengoi]